MSASIAAPTPTERSLDVSQSSTPTWEPQPVQTVEFQIESPDDSIDGKGIVARHEGAAINYLFVSGSNVTMQLHFDPQTHTLFQPVNNNTNYRFNVNNNIAMLTGTGNQPVTLDNYYLNYNNSVTGFGACKDVKDPYGISKTMPAISYLGDGNMPHNCSPISLKVSRMFMVL